MGITEKEVNKWPKVIPPLTKEQKKISDDFMLYWLTILPKKYGMLEQFNHGYPVAVASPSFCSTLEIGAGTGEHLKYEKLSKKQLKNYTAVDIRANVLSPLKEKYPDINTICGDCQQQLPFEENYFDRIIAIHVLEHLPDLPAAVRELHRLCNKSNGQLSIVIPCEGGFAYSCCRAISAKRIFEKRYKQSYQWFIGREHINSPKEIFTELNKQFTISSIRYYPLYVPSIHCNVCIGANFSPKIC